MGLDSSVGIATRYRLDGRGSNPDAGEILRTNSDRPWGPHNLLYSEDRVCYLVVKRPGRGVNHLMPSSAEVKERVELYFYSPSGPSWSVPGRNFTLSCYVIAGHDEMFCIKNV